VREATSAGRVLRLLGLGVRAGGVLPGVEGTRALLRRGDCRAVVVASDASPRARQKAVAEAARRGVPVIAGPDAGSLGASLGRPPVMVVGIRDRHLAEGVAAAAAQTA
jgi:ribosomal protein L7Ae-like RNA K-turn-binding protein